MNIGHILALVLVMTGVLLAAPAAAQQTGSRIDNGRFVADPVAGWRYGRCLAGYKTEQSEALLAAAPSSAASNDIIGDLVNRNYDRCYIEVGFGGQRMVLVEPLLRGQVSQGLYLRAFSDGPPPQIASAEPGEIAVEVYNQRISSAADPRAEIIQIFGDCVVAANPLGVDRRIRTDVSTDEDGRALAALGSHFDPCLWQGQSIEFSAESLRASLAAALYRRARGRTQMTLADGVPAQ